MRRDERGSAMLFAISMVFTAALALAVLMQNTSALNVGRAYQKAQSTDMSADAVAEQIVQNVRLDPLAGVDADGDPLAANLCHDPTSWGTIPAPSGYEVHCQPADGSGGGLGLSPSAPSNAVLTLGGQLQNPGNSRFVSGGTNSFATDPYYMPFCDDWHDYQVGTGGNGNRCEAGLYVGRAVTGTDDGTDGGLVIGSSNSLQHDPRGTVVTNGAIIAGYANGGNARQLISEGPVWARSACGALSSTNWDTFKIWQNWGTVVGKSNPSCWNNSNGSQCPIPPGASCAETFSTTNAAPANSTLVPDPDYVHEPMDLANLPAVDNQSSTPAPYRLDPDVLCTNTGGVAVMPAAYVGMETGKKVYAAIYDNAADLTAFMGDTKCKDTFFWFRPGVYYFDFLDSSGSTAWVGPYGCIPSQDSCVADQILAGSPSSELWSECTTDWDTLPVGPTGGAPSSCLQPAKVMTSFNDVFDTDTKWTTPENVDKMDGQFGSSWVGDGNARENVNQSDWLTPLPIRTGTNITSLKLEVGFSLPSPSTYYGNDVNVPAAGAGASIKVTIPGHGSCYIHLNPDGAYPDNDKLSDPTWPTPQHPTGNNSVFDLTNGCDMSQSGVVKRDPSFPQPSDCGTLPISIPQPPPASFTVATYPNCLRLHPEWINRMSATFDVTAGPAATGTNQGQLKLDAMQLNVAWNGRPAPQYPNGCKISDPGVQWIFGGTARMDWGNSSSHDVIVELCASKQNQFPPPAGWAANPTGPTADPNETSAHLLSTIDHAFTPAVPNINNVDYTTGNGNAMGIGIYGLSDDSSPMPSAISTKPGETSSQLNLTYDSVHSSSSPVWLSSGSGPPKWSDVNAVDANTASTSPASWIGTNNNAAKLEFAMPDLTGAPYNIPPESTITNVQVEVRHREGALDASNVVQPGAFVKGVELRIDPMGVTGVGANGYKASVWDSSSTANSNVPVFNSLATCSAAGTQYCTFKWGDSTAAWPTVPGGGPGSPISQLPAWPMQRDLTDQMSTVEGLSAAHLRWTVGVNGISTAGWKHYAVVDQIRLRIAYRPMSGSSTYAAARRFRPLRGCLTTRTAWHPSTLVGADTIISPVWGTVTAPGHDWLDGDWGVYDTSAGVNNKGDKAFGDYSGTDAGNGGPTTNDEKSDCPLLNVANAPGRVKFHLQGTIYAPSAALSLSGNGNDAQWATQNITARQLSAVRLKNARGIPAVGDENVPRAPRAVKIVICDAGQWNGSGCNPNRQVLSTTLSITDLPSLTGFKQDVLSWIRNSP
jgi:hypothetical protein